jgi:hypothetical protein
LFVYDSFRIKIFLVIIFKKSWESNSGWLNQNNRNYF